MANKQDNTLISTVNKNLEIAMAKYSSITGQLAEMRKKILGPTQNGSEHQESQSGSYTEDFCSNPKTPEGNYEEVKPRKQYEGNNSVFVHEESFSNVSGDSNGTGREGCQKNLSYLTFSNSTKESDSGSEEREDYFSEMLRKFKNKTENTSKKLNSSSSSKGNLDLRSKNLYSDDDKTIENLFLEEISKIDENEISSLKDDVSKNCEINAEELSDESIMSDFGIPCHDILPNKPINISSVLNDDTILDGSVKIKLSKNFLSIGNNDDETVNIKTKISQKNVSKKKTGLKKSNPRKKSHESNVNTIISGPKTVKSKSINPEKKNKLAVKNSCKQKKEKVVSITKAENVKKGIVKETKSEKLSNKKTGSKNIEIIKQQFHEDNNSVNNRKPKSRVAGEEKCKPNRLSSQTIEIKNDPKVQAKDKRNSKNTISSMNNEGENKQNVSKDNKQQYSLTEETTTTSPIIKSNKLILNDIEEKMVTKNGAAICKDKKGHSKVQSGIELTVPNPKDILSKIEEEIRSAKIKNAKMDKQNIELQENTKCKNKNAIKKDSAKDLIKEKNISKGNQVSTAKCEEKSSESTKLKNIEVANRNLVKCNNLENKLQKDGASKIIEVSRKPSIKVQVKPSLKSVISKNDLMIRESNQSVNKKVLSNESVHEIPSEVLSINIDDKKTINFPFILGGSGNKSFNIQANIQQITSLVRLFPKESIHRTLLDEAEAASKVSTRLSVERNEKDGCPACKEKTGFSEGDYNVSDDPWDYTGRNFVRCTCLSKNTISSKSVLRQLLLQSTQGSTMTLESSSSQFEENANRKVSSQDQNKGNPWKRQELAKLLHATQRFVTSL